MDDGGISVSEIDAVSSGKGQEEEGEERLVTDENDVNNEQDIAEGDEDVNEKTDKNECIDKEKELLCEKGDLREGANISDNNVKSSHSSGFDKSSVIYEGDKCIYVDPSSKCRYVWDNDKNDWIVEHQIPQLNGENCDYKFDGTTYRFTDEDTNVEYKWDIDKKEWVVVEDKQRGVQLQVKGVERIRSDEEVEEDDDEDEDKDITKKNEGSTRSADGIYGYENDTHTYTDPQDNTTYVWDRDKNAWFPKVDDDFLAQYQMNYGFVNPNKDDDKNPEIKSDEDNKIKDAIGEKRKLPPQEPTWFEVDEQNNTKVYVSNLPSDITEKEFVDVMQKCGLVMKDVDTGKMKVKLYTERGTNQLKGDGLCTYIKKESVDLALNLLDGYDYKGKKLRVERARFTMKGDAYDPTLKPKKRKKKDKEKLKKMQEKLFDWRPDKLRGERSRNECVVIVKNFFEPGTFDKDVKLILEYQQDLRDECQKLGAVKRVIIYDRHPDGVAQINFKEPEAADACVQLLNGRWFNKRRITAETWDGKTKYKIVETEEELKKRMEKWDSYLLTEEEKFEKEKEMKEKQSKTKEDQVSATNDNENNDKSVAKLSEKDQSVINEEADNSDAETRSSGASDDED